MYLKYFGQNMCCIFCILTTKYNTSGHALPLLGLCNAKSQCHTKYKVRYCTKMLFGSGYCFVRWKDKNLFIPQRPDGNITGYYSVTRTSNVSDISPPLMNALNLLFEQYFEKLF